jgi:NADPH-dependent 2,4-dienoyl-CoA reductase/sulfur reductase-like enzyme
MAQRIVVIGGGAAGIGAAGAAEATDPAADVIVHTEFEEELAGLGTRDAMVGVAEVAAP